MINKPHQRSAWQSLAYIIPVSVLVVIVLCYWDYIPLWDSRAYFDGCILPAVANPFNLFAFNCSNHGTLSFGLLYGAAQYFDYGNILYAHLTSIALLCISFYFYYLILKHLFTNS